MLPTFSPSSRRRLSGLILALLAATCLTLPCRAASDDDLPADCPVSDAGTKPMPGALPTDEGFVDFLRLPSGEQVTLYYSQRASVAAELVRTKLPTSSAAYKLYDRSASRDDVSAIADWPNGACTGSPAANESSLGPALAELRDTALAAANSSSAPCLVALLAPDLAQAHGHQVPANASQRWNLTWALNGTVATACFAQNRSAGVWRIRVELTSSNASDAEVSGATLELLVSVTTGNLTTWLASETRQFRFLSGQRVSGPLRSRADALASTPPFTVCNGSARELPAPLPATAQQPPGNLRLTLLATDDALLPDDLLAPVVEVTDDLAANGARVWTLTPQPGSRLHRAFGPGRLRMTAVPSAGFVFVQDMTRGNCSVDDKGDRTGLLDRPTLPFNLTSPNWRLTSDAVGSVTRWDGAIYRRYLTGFATPVYEVYYRIRAVSSDTENSNATSFADLAFFAVKDVTGVVRLVSVGQGGDAPLDYDGLTACGGFKRVVARLEAKFDNLSTVPLAILAAKTRAAVAAAVPDFSPIRVVSVGVAKDAVANLTQLWFTIVDWPSKSKASTTPELAVKLLAKAVASPSGLMIAGYRVAQLNDSTDATDAGRGGGGGPVVVVNQGHSGGAMVLLAFFMILLGAGLGVLGAWCVWKRRPNMPYYVQD